MKLLREPLVQFLLAGALLFGGYAFLNRGMPADDVENPVKIGEGELRWLRETFASQWQRQPTPQELDGLVSTLVEEELMAREARALGLDQNDTIVRRRLAQKLTFMVEDTSRIANPDDAQLRRFHSEHARRYQDAPRVTFSQIYFSPQRRPNAVGDATAALTSVLATAAESEPPAGGDPLLLDATYSDLDQPAVQALFGADFARVLFGLSTGGWTGPVTSAFGVHLVRLTRLRPAEPRRFEDVRDQVLNDWRRDRERETKAAYLARLRDRYGVIIESSGKPSLDRKPTVAATP